MSHLKFRKVVMVALTIFVLVAALATPMAAAQAAPVQQSGTDKFCQGLEALIFSPENPLPAGAPCDSGQVTRYTLIEPWRAGCEGASTDPDCNVGFRLTTSWSEILDWLKTHKFDRGSVWANPLVVAGPPVVDGDGYVAAPPADGVYGPQNLWAAVWPWITAWGLPCLGLLLIVALILGIVAWLRGRTAEEGGDAQA